MEGLLECSSCAQNFDLEEHRPKLLACGHTLCRHCVSNNGWGGRVRCPHDDQEDLGDPDSLIDDLQLVCWLEATAQGVLECVCCGCPFDWLVRRPTALDCGHAVCRLCLQEANETGEDSGRDSSPSLPPPASLPRRGRRHPTSQDSVDEPWDFYSKEDGGTSSSSSLSSLPSDDGDLVQRVDCPMAGCGRGVRARDHQHLLHCLDGTASRAARAHRARGADKTGEELIVKLAQLEKHVMRGVSMDGVLPAERRGGCVILDTPTAATVMGKTDETHLEAIKDLLADLRRVVEHKNSPRSEQLDVFNITTVNTSLPDLLINEKSSQAAYSSVDEDVCAIENLKESKIEVDVWEMSLSNPQEMRVRKEKLVHSASKVWKLTGVDCWCDPEWSLRLLRKVAPDVEQLQLRYPTRQHLQVVRDCMPHLRRLEVRGWSGIDLVEEPFSFEGASAKNTLEWLEVFLPRPTAMSLLRSHRRSLRKLRVVVSDEWMSTVDSPEPSHEAPCAVSEESMYPDSIDGFVMAEDVDEEGFCVVPFAEDAMRSRCWDDLLAEYGDAGAGGASSLASLSLLWPSSHTHDYYNCRQFARTLEKARPHISVDCDVCRQKPTRLA